VVIVGCYTKLMGVSHIISPRASEKMPPKVPTKGQQTLGMFLG